MDLLPEEIYIQIFKNFEYVNLLKLMFINKKFFRICFEVISKRKILKAVGLYEEKILLFSEWNSMDKLILDIKNLNISLGDTENLEVFPVRSRERKLILRKTIKDIYGQYHLPCKHFSVLKNISVCKKLEKLKIDTYCGKKYYEYHLNNFPEEIFNCKNLKSLSFSNIDIRKLPNSIIKLQNLEDLSLINIYLEELPEEISELKNLKNLELIANKLNKLPKYLYLLKLNCLDIRINPIQEIDKNLITTLGYRKKIFSNSTIQDQIQNSISENPNIKLLIQKLNSMNLNIRNKLELKKKFHEEMSRTQCEDFMKFG